MNNKETMGDALTPQNQSMVSEPSNVGEFGDIGTTTNMANTIKVSQNKPMNLDSALLDTMYAGTQSSLIDYLQRPILVTTGIFQSTDVPTTFVKRKLLDTITSNSYIDSKLLGRYAFRADVRLRLQVNASRFQQGRYILAWIPSGGDNGMAVGDNFNLFHAANAVQITQLPHVEIDISCDTAVELLIPYTAYFSSTMVVNAAVSCMDIGTFFIYPYSALAAATGALECDYALWMNFENIQLFGSAIPQSGMSMKVKKKKKQLPSEEEADAAGKGPISTTLSGISTFAGILSTIPMLTEVAAPVSWVTGVLAQTAQSFGWSKPLDQSSATRVVRTPQPFFGPTDVADTSLPLSTSISNSISPLPGFAGTDIDELSIDYLKSIPAYFNTVTWSTVANAGTALWNYKVSPGHLGKTYTGLGGTMTAFPPVAYISRPFQFWRGSLKFTFKFVKTEFHSGRLMVSFNPVNANYNGFVGSTNIQNCQYVIREIFDVRRGSEFTVTVPYINTEPWAKMDANGYTGYLSAIVLDPLVAPSTVSSSITILVEVCGGDDFQLSVPVENEFGLSYPTLMASYQSGTIGQARNDEECVVSDIVLGGASRDSESVTITPSYTSIGEHIRSFRALLKRYSPLGLTTVDANSKLLYNDVNNPLINLTDYMDIWIDIATNNKPTRTSTDMYTFIGSAFGLFRGSVRYRITDVGPTSSNTTFGATLDSRFAPTATAAAYCSSAYTAKELPNVYNFSNWAIGQTISNAGIEITKPFYNNNHSVPVRGLLINGTNATFICSLNTSSPEVKKGFVLVSKSAVSDTVFVSRALGDDASFGRFISCPVLFGNILYT